MSGEVEEAKGQLRKALQIAEAKHEDQLIEQVGIRQACEYAVLEKLQRLRRKGIEFLKFSEIWKHLLMPRLRKN